MNSTKIAFLIKKRRKELGITQHKLAELSEVSVRKISDIETAFSDTSVGTLQKVLEVLGLEMRIDIKRMDNDI